MKDFVSRAYFKTCPSLPPSPKRLSIPHKSENMLSLKAFSSPTAGWERMPRMGQVRGEDEPFFIALLRRYDRLAPLTPTLSRPLGGEGDVGNGQLKGEAESSTKEMD